MNAPGARLLANTAPMGADGGLWKGAAWCCPPCACSAGAAAAPEPRPMVWWLDRLHGSQCQAWGSPSDPGPAEVVDSTYYIAQPGMGFRSR